MIQLWNSMESIKKTGGNANNIIFWHLKKYFPPLFQWKFAYFLTIAYIAYRQNDKMTCVWSKKLFWAIFIVKLIFWDFLKWHFSNCCIIKKNLRKIGMFNIIKYKTIPQNIFESFLRPQMINFKIKKFPSSNAQCHHPPPLPQTFYVPKWQKFWDSGTEFANILE